MATVLIVEDEYLVRVGLRTCMDWESQGFTLLDDAVDGLDAYQKIHQLKPDIMLLDLKMPRMSGFDLMQKLEDEGIFINIIILSCCDDFDSVRTALRHKVVDYVNKLTMNPTELLRVLNKIKILPSSHGVAEKTDGETHCPDASILLDKVINHNESLAQDERKLFPGGFLACVILTSQKPGHIVASSIKLNMCRQILKSCGVESIICLTETDNICIVLPKNADKDTIAAALKLHLEPTLDALCSIGFSDEYGDWSELKSRYLHASQIADELFWDRPGHVAVYTRMQAMDAKHKAFYQENKKSISCNICAKNASGVLKEIDDFFYYFSHANNIPKDEFLQYTIAILKLFQPNSGALESQYYHCQKTIINAQSVSVVHHELLNFANITFTASSENSDGYSPIVAKAIEFIIQNPSRFVQLTEAARYVNVSTPYLSQLFKKETGVNFVTYVHRYKVNLSKQMLNDHIRINEICDKIGFDNANYFTRIFKRFTGVSPKEYRNDPTDPEQGSIK